MKQGSLGLTIPEKHPLGFLQAATLARSIDSEVTMASRAPPAPSATSGYSVVSYPAEYIYSPGGYPAHPHGMPAVSSMPVMECSAMPTSPPGYPTHYATGIAYAHMSQLGQAPPSPMLAHAHAPSSPHHAPSSPDRSSADTKVMRQILTAMTKMQSTMKELAERQEQALDRMSLLEQRGKHGEL